ncbi:MAG: hypothetical protein C0505_01145 [Leptothrix sp. (in: Bacteria)]|nr:hypothetical protein [Leptothrix sp. (in: b-proteobacteria)]
MLLALAFGVAGLLAWWLRADAPDPDTTAAAPPFSDVEPSPTAAGTLPPAPPAARPGPPLSALGRAEQAGQRALWEARLERARHSLDAYRAAAQYPHESRPIAEHPDQQRPFEPIAEERALRMPGGGSAAPGVRLRTTQERIFASGLESSRVTLTLSDDAGRALPLRVNRAVLKEVTPPGQTARTAEVALDVNDAGRQGDAVAGDGTLTALMQPGAQGFGSFAGTVRLELNLEHAGQPGFIYFDLVYTPEVAGAWLPGVREAASPAGLEFFVKARLLLPGRYVVSARIDDAAGKPLALALFNGEVGQGEVEFRLPVFGKLLRDGKPVFPLVLRDIEAFLLKPDAFPDRVMLPRRVGVQHRSREYALASFSNAEWASEERTRYLTEFGKDVAEAEQKLRQLGP